MGLISRLGAYLDYVFAPKCLRSDFEVYRSDIQARLASLDANLLAITNQLLNADDPLPRLRDDQLKLRDELTALKAIMKISTGKTQDVSPRPNLFDGSKAWRR